MNAPDQSIFVIRPRTAVKTKFKYSSALLISFLLLCFVAPKAVYADVNDVTPAVIAAAQPFIQNFHVDKKLAACPAIQANQQTTVTVSTIRLLVPHHLITNPKLTPLSGQCPSGICNLVAACNAVLNYAITPQPILYGDNGPIPNCTPSSSQPGNCSYATQGKVLAAINIVGKPFCVVQSDIAVTHYFGMYVPQLNVTYDWDVYDITGGKLKAPDDTHPSIAYMQTPPPYTGNGQALSSSCAIPAVQQNYVAHQWQQVLPGNEPSQDLMRINAAFKDASGHWWVPKINPAQFGAIALLGAGVDASYPSLHNVRAGFDAAAAVGYGEIGPNPPLVNRTLVDWLGHETEMASVLGADNIPGAGMTGMLPGVIIYSVKTANDTGATTLDPLNSGLDWIALHREDKNIKEILSARNPTEEFLTALVDDLQCGLFYAQNGLPAVTPTMQRVCYFQYNTPLTITFAAGDSLTDTTGNFDILLNGSPYSGGAYGGFDGFADLFSGNTENFNFPQNLSGVMAATEFTDFDGKPGGLGAETSLPSGCNNDIPFLQSLGFVDDTYPYQTGPGGIGSNFGADYIDDPSSPYYFGFVTASHFLSASMTCSKVYNTTYDGNCGLNNAGNPNVYTLCKTGSTTPAYDYGETSYASPLVAGYLALLQNGWFGFFPDPYTQQNIYKTAVNLGAQSNTLFPGYQPQNAPEVPLLLIIGQDLPGLNGAYFGWAVPPIHNPNDNSDFNHGAAWVGHQ